MDSAQLLVTVLGAGGGGAALLALINGFYKWLNGSAGREREKNTSLVSQRKSAIEEREAAERERDSEAKHRRNVDEYAAMLRRQLIEAGLEPIPMPVDRSTLIQENEEGDIPLNTRQPSRYIGDKNDDERDSRK